MIVCNRLTTTTPARVGKIAPLDKTVFSCITVLYGNVRRWHIFPCKQKNINWTQLGIHTLHINRLLLAAVKMRFDGFTIVDLNRIVQCAPVRLCDLKNETLQYHDRIMKTILIFRQSLYKINQSIKVITQYLGGDTIK